MNNQRRQGDIALKICKITKDIYDIYSAYIPKRYSGYLEGNEYRFWGIYNKKQTLGAVILHFFDGNVEIVSLRYDSSAPMGEVEALVTKTIEKVVKKENVYSIVYAAEGTEEFFSDYDYEMMDLGYVSRYGDVDYYTTRLGDMAEKLEKYLDILRKNKNDNAVKASEVTRIQINKFNLTNQDNPYNESEFDSELSMFLLKDREIIGGTYVSYNEAGDVVFNWMNFHSKVNNVEKMKLIYATILNAADKLPAETNVIVCPFSEEVRGIVTTFGFTKETTEDHRVHVYTKYL